MDTTPLPADATSTATLPPLEEVSPAEALEVIGEPSAVDPRAVAAASGKPAAPAAAASAPSAPAPSGPAAVDKRGHPFDPTKHECTLDGQPVRTLEGVDVSRLVPGLTKDGKLRLRSYVLPEFRERSSVVDPSAPAAPPPAAATAPGAAPAPAAPAAAVASDAEVRATAATFAGLQLMVMQSALGKGVGEDEEQRAQLVVAWEATIRHYGVGFTHPLLGLAMTTGGMVLVAMKHEETRSRLGEWTHRVKSWAYGLWVRWRYGKRAPRPTEVEAAPTHGQRDRERPAPAAPAEPSSVAAAYPWPPINA